ncbi:MAG: CBS domain-containing protein [Pyrinomonadaceae bacterium]
MKVRNMMTADVKTCGVEDDLARAATIMWERDCGSVPVVDATGKIVGMLTDRDICMAVAFKARAASAIKAGEIISGDVYACHADDNAKAALDLMQRYKLRRLPVIGDGGVLQGILSINDVILHSKRGDDKKAKHVSHKDVMETLKALSEHRAPASDQAQADETNLEATNL